MMKLPQLPDDILLLVVQDLDVDSLLAFRKVSNDLRFCLHLIHLTFVW